MKRWQLSECIDTSLSTILTDFAQERESVFSDCDVFDLANTWEELIQLLNSRDVSIFHCYPNFGQE